MDYKNWPRAKLIEHVEAYSHSLHELANTAMKQEYELRKLRPIAARVQPLATSQEFMGTVSI